MWAERWNAKRGNGPLPHLCGASPGPDRKSHEGKEHERETRRGTADPTYLVYNLGKLQILELREDYRKLRGADFRLREFHDRYMEQGSVPNVVIRRALLGPQ